MSENLVTLRSRQILDTPQLALGKPRSNDEGDSEMKTFCRRSVKKVFRLSQIVIFIFTNKYRLTMYGES